MGTTSTTTMRGVPFVSVGRTLTNYYTLLNPKLADKDNNGAITALEYANANAVMHDQFSRFKTNLTAGLDTKEEYNDAASVFDVEYYLQNNPDVAAATGNNEQLAREHFLKFGINEKNRNPNAFFNTQEYLNRNPDVAAAVARGETTAFEQFNAFGKNERNAQGQLIRVVSAQQAALPEASTLISAQQRAQTGTGIYIPPTLPPQPQIPVLNQPFVPMPTPTGPGFTLDNLLGRLPNGPTPTITGTSTLTSAVQLNLNDTTTPRPQSLLDFMAAQEAAKNAPAALSTASAPVVPQTVTPTAKDPAAADKVAAPEVKTDTSTSKSESVTTATASQPEPVPTGSATVETKPPVKTADVPTDVKSTEAKPEAAVETPPVKEETVPVAT